MSGEEVLEGVNVEGGLSALARWRAQRKGVATFARLGDAPPERRREKRRDARLRWGKALDGADRFLCECVVADQARGGVRLRLARNIPLPQRFQFFDDVSGDVFAAQIVWRRGVEVGCRLARAPAPDKAQVARRMRSRYYGL